MGAAATVVRSQNKLCVCVQHMQKTPQTENVRLFILKGNARYFGVDSTTRWLRRWASAELGVKQTGCKSVLLSVWSQTWICGTGTVHWVPVDFGLT